MTIATVPPPAELGAPTGRRSPAAHRLAHVGLLRDLDRTGQVFETLTPNWFASVMGTGIVAIAAARLPVRLPGLHPSALVAWALAAVLLVALLGSTAVHWVRYPANARSHLRHPVMAHFYGAAPMALLTVGAATLVVGRQVVGSRVAVDTDWVLWFAGTVAGVATAVVVPYAAFTRGRARPESAFGGWLMPVVPPVVSASTGALLLSHVPAGHLRLSLLVACYALLGVGVLASIVPMTLVVRRLARHGAGEARMVPTLWIILGPLGQSVTAATLLGANAHLVFSHTGATVLETFGVAYGLPVMGLAVVWMVIAGAITIRTAQVGLPFSLTWWSFTFPVGTCVTGTTGLALATGSDLLRGTAVVLFAGLVTAWLVVAARTTREATSGRAFLPAPVPAAAPVLA